VPVLSETALLAVVINRQRPFQFIHGDVVHTPDILGQRFGRLSKQSRVWLTNGNMCWLLTEMSQYLIMNSQ
jgi:hypothetical protein